MAFIKLETKSIYDQWGFKSSPFETSALPADVLGATLLTGRDKELQALATQLTNGTKYPTIEGLNGVGKTSIANVAAYLLFRQYLEAGGSGGGGLFIPCRKIFQLTPGRSLDDFCDDVYFEVAQTLMERAAETKRSDKPTLTKALDKWLNAPQLSALQGGFSLATFGINLGEQTETNTSKGFERSGFRKAINDWLENIFPTPADGGVVCVIDNLELLQSSEVARSMVEQLRDRLFGTRGLRWVLCGALGIVYGVVASPRLSGHLQPPIPVGEIPDAYAGDILVNRVRAFTKPGFTSTLPLTESDFKQLYSLLRGILRSVLSSADDYCAWVHAQGLTLTTDEERHKQFGIWLAAQCADEFGAIQKQLRATALRVFKRAVEVGGVFSPSDFESFGFNGIQQFRPSIRDLEGVGLLVSTRDEGDKRRKTIQVTDRGWKVNHHLTTVTGSVVDPRQEDGPEDVGTAAQTGAS